MGGHRANKQLIPRANASKANLDVIMVVDGSGSVDPSDFQKEKQLCNAISARMGQGSQLGVIQFGSQAKIEASLTTKVDELEKKIEAMVQVGGGTNLNAAFAHCVTEFGLSKCPNNAKHVWIITDGNYEDSANTAVTAQRLKRQQQATIFAIGVGPHVTLQLLNRVASPGCSFLVKDFEGVFKILKSDVDTKDLRVQLAAEITFPNNLPLRLGEDTIVQLCMTNVGIKFDIPKGSRVIFKDNAYFKEKFAITQEPVPPGDEITMNIKLIPKTKGNRANLDTQMQAVPEVLELLVFDPNNNEISADCSGFCLNHEDFSGDIFTYAPQYQVPCANIITFGPPGAGKSSFVNSVCSALGDSIKALNVAGATRDVVTSGLLRFPLNLIPEFEGLRFSLYDVPGVDGLNYKGDEMAMLMYGILPRDVDFKHNAYRFEEIENRRDRLEVEQERRAHVVAFFVPQGAAGDSDLMKRLATFYTEIVVKHKRKAIVIISHADEIVGEDDRKDILEEICEKLAIDASSVFFLENYVDSKIKQFNVDKAVLRILLAMICRTDDFLTFERLNPSPPPFPAHPQIANPKYQPPTAPAPSHTTTTTSSPQQQQQASPQQQQQASPTSTQKKAEKPPPPPPEDEEEEENFIHAFLAKFNEPLKSKLTGILADEAIDDEDTLRMMTDTAWKGLELKTGEIIKISNALKSM